MDPSQAVPPISMAWKLKVEYHRPLTLLSPFVRALMDPSVQRPACSDRSRGSVHCPSTSGVFGLRAGGCHVLSSVGWFLTQDLI